MKRGEEQFLLQELLLDRDVVAGLVPELVPEKEQQQVCRKQPPDVMGLFLTLTELPAERT